MLIRTRLRFLRWLPHRLLSHWKIISFVICLIIFELIYHINSLSVIRPPTNLDPPFYTGCQNPVLNTSARANATLMMLARNSDVDGAVASVESVQQQFNANFGYPWVFLNNEEWSEEFINKVTKAGKGADMRFETIPTGMWGYPAWIDQKKARRSMDNMKNQGIMYAGAESYHHMCRFQSGFFYDHPALQAYKWYWRVEPEITFTCAITYDPFTAMAERSKTYGYTIALWEDGRTVASLFRKLSDYKAAMQYPSNSLWAAMKAPSYAPILLRSALALLRNRDAAGDVWNMCHFWSNFEIADMDFYRSDEYRKMFRMLDNDGGFYYERWGDAPVHSLAAAMLLRPEQVHHFADFGYRHDKFQYCTYAPTEREKRRGVLVPDERGGGEEFGCRCTCDKGIERVNPTCFNQIKRSVM